MNRINGLSVFVFGHIASGDFALFRQLEQAGTHVGKLDPGGGSNLDIEQLAVFLQMLENRIGVHLGFLIRVAATKTTFD
ncbi:MAG TPA: hypothetical protein VGK09_12130 [Rhodocyclaceae bacterium]